MENGPVLEVWAQITTEHIIYARKPVLSTKEKNLFVLRNGPVLGVWPQMSRENILYTA